MTRKHAQLRTLASTLRPMRMETVKPAPKRADPFYLSPEWRKLMSAIVARRGRKCQQCGKTHDTEGKPIRVFGDHVIELKDGGAPLDESNVRLLCGACHTAKTAKVRAERQARRW